VIPVKRNQESRRRFRIRKAERSNIREPREEFGANTQANWGLLSISSKAFQDPAWSTKGRIRQIYLI